ncbi:mechanosensitive ion channel domain-containing protein [Rhizobium sp. L1K21]|uniref:mechanosensitive ion channel family protein n=1 Tax=Rhizobium sp. L1K21 TaxID=2954933 RepID=UPI0020938A8D|nr:mechanosensitive ion channel [Rhizobium sp. L1K21]
MDIIINSAPGLWLKSFLLNPWGLYQLAIIAVGFLVAKLVDRWAEPLMEERARQIRGNPDLLRVIIAFMRRLEWLFFVLWLWAARGIVLYYTAWPSRVWLIGLALTLASVWFLVSVLTRIIRNRSIARFVAFVAWVYIALYMTGFDREVMRALDGAAITAGTFRISLYSTIKAVVVSVALVWVAVLIGNVVSNRIERLDDLSPAYRVLLGKLVKIGLIIFAGAAALTATGIDLTALTVFSGAVGVGIGFGLQKVVSNFISGIIILSDKSIKPGDTISLGDTFGWIRELRARFVSVITRDGKEYLIPNEDFITQQVVNWSFSSDFVRIDVDFGVSYDSNPHQVTKIAIETAKGIKRVTNYREPVCWMTAFGTSSLDFKLRFWITDPNNGLTNVRGQVLLALWDAFKEAGVNIPFPHREVIMRSPVDVTVTQQTSGTSSKPETPKA